MQTRCFLIFFAWAVVSNFSLARAGSYSFASIADTNGAFVEFDSVPQGLAFEFGSPSINNVGGVAFMARTENGTIGIFAGPDPINDRVVNDSSFLSLFAPTIDDSGTVYFGAMVDDDRSGIFSGPDPVLDLIVDVPYLTDMTLFFGPAVSGNGTLAYSFNNEFVVRSPTGDTTVYESDAGAGTAATVDVNNHGTAVFPSGNGLYVGQGSQRDVLVEDTFSQFFSINDAGTVVAVVISPDGGENLLTGTHLGFDVIVDTNGPYTGLLPPVSINNHGQIAFAAWLNPSEERGVFTGPNPETDAIIVPGDELFGSRLKRGRYSAINDAGQIAFAYTLENGIQGVAVATPVPEPSTLVSFLIAASFAVRRFRPNVR